MVAHPLELLLRAVIYKQRNEVKFSGYDPSFNFGNFVPVTEISLGFTDNGD